MSIDSIKMERIQKWDGWVKKEDRQLCLNGLKDPERHRASVIELVRKEARSRQRRLLLFFLTCYGLAVKSPLPPACVPQPQMLFW